MLEKMIDFSVANVYSFHLQEIFCLTEYRQKQGKITTLLVQSYLLWHRSGTICVKIVFSIGLFKGYYVKCGKGGLWFVFKQYYKMSTFLSWKTLVDFQIVILLLVRKKNYFCTWIAFIMDVECWQTLILSQSVETSINRINEMLSYRNRW